MLRLHPFGRAALLDVGVMSVVKTHEIAAHVYMIVATKLGVHFFQHDTFRLWHEEVNEECKQNVDSSKHVEGIEAAFLIMKLDIAADNGYQPDLP